MQTYKLDNIVASFPDERDFYYQPKEGPFPSQVDLKPDVYEVDNQLSVGSCTANATTSAIELLLKQQKQNPQSLSRLFLYWNTRNVIEDRAGQEGAVLRSAVRSAKRQGVCYESEWPYIESNKDVKPSAQSYQQVEHLNLKTTRYERVEINVLNYDREVILNNLKSVLSDGLPIIWAGVVGSKLYNLTGPWREHNYTSAFSSDNTYIGGHAMLIIGYDDSCQKFLVENSWGSSWGDGGFCGIPYNVIVDDAFEAWVIRGFKDAYVQPNPSTDSKPLTINTLDSHSTYETDISANPATIKIELNPSGGKLPLKVKWDDLRFNHSFDKGNNTLSLQYYFSQNENQFEADYMLKVRDSNVVSQSNIEKPIRLKFVRGQEAPKPDNSHEEVKSSEDRSNTPVIIASVLLILAIGAKLLGYF